MYLFLKLVLLYPYPHQTFAVTVTIVIVIILGLPLYFLYQAIIDAMTERTRAIFYLSDCDYFSRNDGIPDNTTSG